MKNEQTQAVSARLRRHLWMLACAPIGAAAVALPLGCLALLPMVDQPSRLICVVGALAGLCVVVVLSRKWVGRVAAGTLVAASAVLLCQFGEEDESAYREAVRTLRRVLDSRVGPFRRLPRDVHRVIEAALARDEQAGGPGRETVALLDSVADACQRWADALDIMKVESRRTVAVRL